METAEVSNYLMGFDLGGSSLKYGYGNDERGLIYFNKITHQNKSLEGIIASFKCALQDMEERHNDFSGLCLASPGIIDAEKGIILGSSPNLTSIQNVNLKEILQDLAKIPAMVENDANLMTFAEAKHCNSQSVLGITIGSGIGTGFVDNNKIFHGEKWLALEAGHTTVVPNGRQCLCGKKGCLEAYCSANSMERIIKESHPELAEAHIFELLNNKTPDIKAKFREILNIFAVGLANLVIVLNPGTLVIGGGVIEIESFDFEYLRSQVYANLNPEFRDFEIKKAIHGNKAGVIGGIYYGALRLNHNK
jgi:glucokinase